MSDYFSKVFHVRKEERWPVFFSALFFFFIMTGLMMLRPARESLGMARGMDDVRWLFIGTAVVTLAVNPVFGWLVSKFRRISFITCTYSFFALSLVGFWALLVYSPSHVGERSGQVFYVWYSVFNLFAVMLFWALLADRFAIQQSKRFFPLLAAGGTLGAIFGPWMASILVGKYGTPALLLFAAGALALAIGCAWAVTSCLTDQALAEADHSEKADKKAVIGGSAWGGLHAVLKSKYLLGIAAFVLCVSVTLTFIYFTRLAMVAEIGHDIDQRTGIFARLDMITQVTTLVLQLSVAGWIMKKFGVAIAMALLPLTVLAGFIGLAISASLAALVVLDAAVKAVQRAVMRPARETLFTVVSREDKYKAKAFIDTFVYRGGDVLGAQTEGLLKSFGLGVTALTMLVIPMSVIWAGLALWLGRQQTVKAREKAAAGG